MLSPPPVPCDPPSLSSSSISGSLAMQSSSEVAIGPYRYALTRVWDDNKPKCIFFMFNSSTADGTRNDPTLRRVLDFAQDNGFGSLEVLNLFALRGADPKMIFKCHKCIESAKSRKSKKRRKSSNSAFARMGPTAANTVCNDFCYYRDMTKDIDDYCGCDGGYDKNATKRVLKCHECALVDPVGDKNDEVIINRIVGSTTTTSVCLGWGTPSTKKQQRRANEVLQLLHNLQSHYSFPVQCLELTNLGFPRHPLYIKKGVKMKPYRQVSDTGMENGDFLSDYATKKNDRFNIRLELEKE